MRNLAQRKLSRSVGYRPSETSATYFAAAVRICAPSVGILPYEFGLVGALEQAEHVVQHEDLPVTVRAGSDADCGDGRRVGDLGGELARDAFEHNAESACLGHGRGVGEQFL